jgi:hypothetical protein
MIINAAGGDVRRQSGTGTVTGGRGTDIQRGAGDGYGVPDPVEAAEGPKCLVVGDHLRGLIYVERGLIYNIHVLIYVQRG